VPLCFCIIAEVLAYDPDLHDFNYTVDLEIKKDQGIMGAFSDLISDPAFVSATKSLRLFSLQDKRVTNMRALKDRIVNDVNTMYKKAHLHGFYGTDIKYKILPQKSGDVLVKIDVDLRQKFKLKLNLTYKNQNDQFHKSHESLLQKELKILKASTEEIRSLIGIAIRQLQMEGFFKPETIEKRVYVDYSAGEATLNLTIDPGQRVFFSTSTVKAFPDIKEEFIKNRITWHEGDVFDIREMETTSESLKDTQIFSKIKITPQEDAIVDQKIPMLIEVKEDKKHTIDFSILYSGMRSMNFGKQSETQKKLKSIISRLSFTNYNTFGGGEKLSFSIEGTPMKVKERRPDYAFEVALSQPDVFIKDNLTDYYLARRQELTNVFFKKNDRLSLMFNYPLRNDLTVSMGISGEKNYIDTHEVFSKNKDNSRNYDTVMFPVEFILNRTDNLLNPTSGYRLNFKCSQMIFGKATIRKLQSFDVGFSYNYPLDEIKRTVFAFNLSRRAVWGASVDRIPIDKRIYAGGMGSVRGYANQMATEMIVGENGELLDIPMGGRSSFEFNTEIRRKFFEDFGGVLFFDGAKIFQNRSRHADLQTEQKKWFLSAGIGIRYFTSIGPIRVDFAFPIKKRKNIDSKVQFIMSLGQAF